MTIRYTHLAEGEKNRAMALLDDRGFGETWRRWPEGPFLRRNRFRRRIRTPDKRIQILCPAIRRRRKDGADASKEPGPLATRPRVARAAGGANGAISPP